MSKYINFSKLKRELNNFDSQKPFPHIVVDNFFKKSIALKLEKEFPLFADNRLHEYRNYCEIKKSSNNWNLFPKFTYKIFTILNSEKITKLISKKLKLPNIVVDPGLHGGGLHLMSRKGKLNPHLDYSLHPKMQFQRKFNSLNA